MQVIVQEGRAKVTLVAAVHAQDESLRSAAVNTLNEEIRAYYRDYEVVRIEARDGFLEIFPAALASIFWLEKARRYQLKSPTAAAAPVAVKGPGEE